MSLHPTHLITNYGALYIAIADQCPPEVAFAKIDGLLTERAPIEYDQQMLALKRLGLTYNEIAEEYGTTKFTVYRRLRRHPREVRHVI